MQLSSRHIVMAGTTTAVWLGLAAAHAASLTSGNVLVTHGDTVYEYTTAGTEVQSWPVPYGGGGARPTTESVRDVVVSDAGDVHVYDGTFTPYISTLDPAQGTWSAETFAGFSTVNNVSYGGLAMVDGGGLGPWVVATDMVTAGASESGLMRFDVLNAANTNRFDTSVAYIDVALGLDDNLYGLVSETSVRVLDPATMTLVTTVTLGAGSRGLAVAADGTIFGASWDGRLYRYDTAGVVQDDLVTGASNLTDIDLAADGTLVAGGRFGDVIFSDTTLASSTSFDAGANETFVAFTDPAPTGAGGAGGSGGSGGSGGANSSGGSGGSGGAGGSGGTGGAGEGGSGGVNLTGGGGSVGGNGGAAASGGGVTQPNVDDAGDMDSEADCGCDIPGEQGPAGGAAWLGLLAAWSLMRRRRRRD